MNVSDIITELNNHGFTDTADTQKMFVVNDTLADIGAVEPWPYLEKSVALNFDGVSTTPTNMPTDFKQVSMLVDQTNGVSIWPERVETVRDRYTNTFLTGATGGDPFLYYIWGGTIRLYPRPVASTGRYYLDYIAQQATLTSADLEAAILLPKRHHRLIVLGSVYKLYAMEDDLQNAQAFQSMYEDKLTRVREDLLRKQYQRSDVIFVTDEDDDYLDN